MDNFPKELAELRHDLNNQDNRMTAHPMYIVQKYTFGIHAWVFNNVFFTQKAAEEYIEENFSGEALDDVRIYVGSGYRNKQWKLLRRFMKGDDRDD
jgi:hypothetical protein